MEEIKQTVSRTEILNFANYEEVFLYLKQHLKGQDLVLFKGENQLNLDDLIESFNDSLTNNQCIINLAAIQANLTLIRHHLPTKTRLMVMVKALAYGTDDVRISKFLAKNGVDILGVSYVDEGVILKQAGVTQAIFSINAALYESAKIVKWELEVGVSDQN